MHPSVPVLLAAVAWTAVEAPAAPAARPAAQTTSSGPEKKVGASSEDNPYAATFAAEGTGLDTFVQMHNRRGLRIELDLDKKALELWISPRAGESLDYRDRNFSNRDDHTRVFDRIALPRLPERRDFVGCDYDPFHSVVRYKDQVLHLATLFDRPVVLVWFEQPSFVDLKTDKQDRLVTRGDRLFDVEHPDRGRSFRFAAALGDGGRFLQQRDVDAGRSTFARAELAAGQVLAIAGELAAEPVSAWAQEAAATPKAQLVSQTETRVDAALARGRARLRGRPELQRVLDLNRRVLLSMQDESGAVRAAIKYIYYLIWVRDGGIINVPAAYSGWVDPLARWTGFLLANPTVSEHEPKGRFFGQLVNGRITKWQEDGLFYAVWSAFTHFSQTGDARYASGEGVAVLRDATDWLERHTFDRDKGLFGRYYDGETPLSDSRGDGWDDAVGSPADRFRTELRGRVVTRSYDLNANLYAWGCYVMLAALDAPHAGEYLDKARALEAKLRPWLARSDRLPDYGELRTREGDPIRATPWEMGMGDYLWAVTLTPFAGEVFDLGPLRERLLRERAADTPAPTGPTTFLASHFPLLASLDTETDDEQAILAELDRFVPQAVRPGRYLPMPYTAPEVAGIEDGHPYHDVRPQAFSVGPWLWAVANLGLRRLPLGIAARPTSALYGIDAYEYRGSLIDVRFAGRGGIESIAVNGELIAHTLQVPEARLVPGRNTLAVGLGPRPLASPVLSSSTVRLRSVGASRGGASYQVEGYGRNVLVFRGRPRVELKDASGGAVRVTARAVEKHTAFEFEGRGSFQVLAH